MLAFKRLVLVVYELVLVFLYDANIADFSGNVNSLFYLFLNFGSLHKTCRPVSCIFPNEVYISHKSAPAELTAARPQKISRLRRFRPNRE